MDPSPSGIVGIAGMGIVLTASATTLLQRLDSSVLLRRTWDRIRRRPIHPGWVVTRGLTLILVGIIIAFRPAESLEALAVVAGGFLFFIGLQEVFGTVTRFALARSVIAAPSRSRARTPVAAVVAGGALAGILIAGGIFWLSRDAGAPTMLGPQAILAVNGYPELRDRRLNEVVFPTTHNSMSAASLANWMFANQEREIRQQLEDGIRGFLIDVHYGEPVKGRIKTLLEDEGNGLGKKYEAVLGKEGIEAAMRIRDRLVGDPEGERKIYLAHGFCELGSTPFVEVLEEIKEFLVQNPNEVLVIVIQDEGVAPADIAASFEEESGLEDFVYRGPVTPPVAHARRDGHEERARGRVRREQGRGGSLVPPHGGGHPGDALRVQEGRGFLERSEPWRSEGIAAPDEPLDRIRARFASEQRGDRERI